MAEVTERMYRLSKNTGSLGLEQRVVENTASQMRLLDEKDVADTFSNTSIITRYNTLSGTSRWDDYANSDPLRDIRDMVVAQRANSSMPVNTFFTSYAVWMTLIMHPVIIDKFKWTVVAGMISKEQFMTLLAPLGITNIHIGTSRYNSQNQGQTASMIDIWGKHAWVGYVTNTPGQFEQNGGYKFSGGPAARKVTKEQKSNPPLVELVNVDSYDHIILDADVYYMLQTVIS